MIIGLTGLLQSGKDTVADRLLQMADVPRSKRVAFADKLKESAADCFPGVTRAQWEDWKVDDSIKIVVVKAVNDKDAGFYGDVLSEQTARGFLQRYGTEAHRRHFGHDFWIDQALAGTEDYDLVVVSDVRFDNEAQAIKDRGGKIVRVIGPDLASGSEHVSEAGISADLVDFKFFNTERSDNYHRLDLGLSRLCFGFGIPTHVPSAKAPV